MGTVIKDISVNTYKYTEGADIKKTLFYFKNYILVCYIIVITWWFWLHVVTPKARYSTGSLIEAFGITELSLYSQKRTFGITSCHVWFRPNIWNLTLILTRSYWFSMQWYLFYKNLHNNIAKPIWGMLVLIECNKVQLFLIFCKSCDILGSSAVHACRVVSVTSTIQK